MFDSLFMRHWEAGPGKFSTHLGRAAVRRLQQGAHRRQPREAIGKPYGFLAKYDDRPATRPVLTETAQASLRGLAASVVTFGLWIAVMALATPMPLMAATADVAATCTAPVALA